MIPYSIVYKPIKNIYIKVTKNGLVISAPKQASKLFIESLIKKHESRYLKRYETLLYQTITLWGHPITIEFQKGLFYYELRGDTLVLQGNEFNTAFQQVLKKELEMFLIKHQDTIKKHLTQFGIAERPYVIKYYKSKYGSYYKFKNYISLNAFLASLDPSILYYVLWHEYAHTKHFHHQKAFYEYLKMLCPKHQFYEKQLKSIAIMTYFSL
jgi:predicted metal-dependent hydrolase